MNLEFIRQTPMFSGLTDNDIAWLEKNATPTSLEAGDLLIEEGTAGDAMYIILEGEFEILKRSGRQDITIAAREKGTVIGEMSLLDDAPRSASVRAKRASLVATVDHETFHQLLANSPTAALAMLHVVSSRLRQGEGLLRQSEKMAALGTLSAGLAH